MVITHNGDINLDVIAYSGQCFRWKRLKDGSYFVPARSSAVRLKPLGGRAIALDCPPAQFNRIWRDYLDLGTDYSRYYSLAADDPFLRRAVSYGRGLRILRQDPWETLVSFILSQCKNIPAIKSCVERICAVFGPEADWNGIKYHQFPSAGDILKAPSSKLDGLKLGYRAKYIRGAAEAVGEGRLDLSALSQMDDKELHDKLVSLHGVGEKISNCVMLFGFARLNAFPVDVWIKRVLENEYPDGFNFNRYSPYNGVLQQFMFYYYRENSQ